MGCVHGLWEAYLMMFGHLLRLKIPKWRSCGCCSNSKFRFRPLIVLRVCKSKGDWLDRELATCQKTVHSKNNTYVTFYMYGTRGDTCTISPRSYNSMHARYFFYHATSLHVPESVLHAAYGWYFNVTQLRLCPWQRGNSALGLASFRGWWKSKWFPSTCWPNYGNPGGGRCR